MKGSYVLLVRLAGKKRIGIGKLGEIEFGPGYYAYVGSAMNGLDKRVSRHLGSRKKLFWHIDYLLQYADVVEVFQVASPERLECRIARKLAENYHPIPGFGCSDCRCGSHFFYSCDRDVLKDSILDALKSRKTHGFKNIFVTI